MKRLTLVLITLLSACSSAPQRPMPPVIDGSHAGTPGEPSPAPVPAAPGRIEVPPPAASGGAVVALLDRAEDYRRAGDSSNEAATIERALRIEPRNARLWHRLAETRLAQGQLQQAEQLALKSNSLSGNDTRLQASNWRLVARVRWSMDDSVGARKAEQRASQLK